MGQAWPRRSALLNLTSLNERRLAKRFEEHLEKMPTDQGRLAFLPLQLSTAPESSGKPTYVPHFLRSVGIPLLSQVKKSLLSFPSAIFYPFFPVCKMAGLCSHPQFPPSLPPTIIYRDECRRRPCSGRPSAAVRMRAPGWHPPLDGLSPSAAVRIRKPLA